MRKKRQTTNTAVLKICDNNPARSVVSKLFISAQNKLQIRSVRTPHRAHQMFFYSLFGLIFVIKIAFVATIHFVLAFGRIENRSKLQTRRMKRETTKIDLFFRLFAVINRVLCVIIDYCLYYSQ